MIRGPAVITRNKAASCARVVRLGIIRWPHLFDEILSLLQQLGKQLKSLTDFKVSTSIQLSSNNYDNRLIQ